MVKNSLLEAYGKYEYLLKELYGSDYKMELIKRAEEYSKKGMTPEYWEIMRALQMFEHYKHLLSVAFSRGLHLVE